MTGQLWESEHGPTGGDEINIIEPRKNYGWGVITMGVQTGITKRTRAGHGAADPLLDAERRAERDHLLHGTQYPGWKNNLFVSCLAASS